MGELSYLGRDGTGAGTCTLNIRKEGLLSRSCQSAYWLKRTSSDIHRECVKEDHILHERSCFPLSDILGERLSQVPPKARKNEDVQLINRWPNRRDYAD